MTQFKDYTTTEIYYPDLCSLSNKTILTDSLNLIFRLRFHFMSRLLYLILGIHFIFISHLEYFHFCIQKGFINSYLQIINLK